MASSRPLPPSRRCHVETRPAKNGVRKTEYRTYPGQTRLVPRNKVVTSAPALIT